MSVKRYAAHTNIDDFKSDWHESKDGPMVKHEDYAALEARFAALAAENAGLKAVCEDRRTFIMNGVQLGYIQVPTVETDPALGTIRVAVSPQEPTPATDAFLAEVRAQGVESFARTLRSEADITKACTFKPVQQFEDFACRSDEFAAQLRKGVQS